MTTADTAAEPRRAGFGFALSQKQVWGLLFVAPYLAIFVAFVVFPVGYAFWLARSPQLYVELATIRSSCAPRSTRWCS